jgi:hypothetical protein
MCPGQGLSSVAGATQQGPVSVAVSGWPLQRQRSSLNLAKSGLSSPLSPNHTRTHGILVPYRYLPLRELAGSPLVLGLQWRGDGS